MIVQVNINLYIESILLLDFITNSLFGLEFIIQFMHVRKIFLTFRMFSTQSFWLNTILMSNIYFVSRIKTMMKKSEDILFSIEYILQWLPSNSIGHLILIEVIENNNKKNSQQRQRWRRYLCKHINEIRNIVDWFHRDMRCQ